jgi:hypothetical protein
MANATPVTVEAADMLGAAIRLRATKEGVSPEEVVNGILRKALAAEIEEAGGALPLAAVIQQVMHANTKA